MFVQLTNEDCAYLLNLIEEIDSTTKYTERQRGYTVPKLQKIQKDPRSARLAVQDVDYLLELMEDDDLEEVMQQREMTRGAVLEIQRLQNERAAEFEDVEKQREMRRARRQPARALAEHFAPTK